MKRLLSIVVLLWTVPAWAGVHTAKDCTPVAVQSLEDDVTADTDAIIEVVIPACSGRSAGHWGNSIPGAGYINFVMPAKASLLWIRGAGSTSVDGGGNATVIYDEKTSNSNPIFIVTPNTTGYLRVSGITFDQELAGGGPNTTRGLGSLNVSGFYDEPQRFRVDHCTFIAHSASIGVGGRVIGVIDHNVFKLDPGLALFLNSWSDAQGDISWTEPTALGSVNFPVLEDNIITVGTSMATGKGTGGIQDSYRGSRFVVRFNDVDRAATQTHPTGGSNRARGTRAWEIYGNRFRNNGPNPSVKEFNVFFASSGTGVVWGNDAVGDTVYDNFITGHVNRRDGSPYDQAAPPDGWGFCGPAYQIGTVNTAGTTVTRVTGNSFSTSWVAKKIVIAGTSYAVSSVNSSTSITLATSAGTQTGAAYTLGSKWDGATDVNTGYPCLDQLGRGKGDRLINDFTTMQNQDTRGTYTSSTAYPRQALEPIYVWSNVYRGASLWNDSGQFGAIVADRDYYLDTGSRMGVGASLPATCTVNDGFYKTGDGTWKTATPTHGVNVTQGRLYKCTSTNTWTLFYTPLDYPHPYIALTNGAASSSTTGAGSPRLRLPIR